MELSEDTKRKEKQAIALLKSVCKNDLCELAYSGGKDSDVLLFLCKKAKIKFKPCYKCTTIDPKGTIKHAKENGAIIKKKPLNKFLFKSTLKALNYFFDNSKNGKKIFASAYDKMVCDLFYKSKKEFDYKNNFSLKFENEKDFKINSKKILEDTFNIKL